MNSFKNMMKKLSPDGGKDGKTPEDTGKQQDELDQISKTNETDKPKDESSMDRNLKDEKNAMGLNKSSPNTKKPNPACPQHGKDAPGSKNATKKPNPACPQHGKDAPGSKDATEKPLQALEKLHDEGKKSDSKPNEQEKEDEYNLDTDLKDMKGPSRGIEMDESSPKSKMPDIASPDQKKDSTGSKDRKDKPSHPLGKLQDEDKDKDSKEKPEDESGIKGSDSSKAKEPDVASPEQDEDITGSKDIKDKPSHPVVKLQDEDKDKDSKEKPENASGIKGLMTRMGLSDSSKAKKPDVASPEQDEDITGSKDIKDKPSDPVSKLQDKGQKDSKPTDQGKQDESNKGPNLNYIKGADKGMNMDEASRKSTEPDITSPGQEKDDTGSKQKKETPSEALTKLQDEAKEKDSKSTDKGKEDESFRGSAPSETADKSKDIALIEDTGPSMDSERCDFCGSKDADPVEGADKKI